MNELAELYAVLAAIYLFDCVHWVRREAIGLRAFFGRRMRVVAGQDMPGNDEQGMVFAQPLPPFGRVFLVQHSPVAWTRDVACSFVLHATNPGARPTQPARAIAWDAIRSVAVESRTVRVNGAPFVRAASEPLARRIAAFLESTRALDASKRERAIVRELEAAFDARSATERVEAFQRNTRGLRAACMVLFAYAFVVVPATALTWGFALTWLPLLCGLAAAQIAVIVLFVRAHRALAPAEKRARRIESLLLSLSPPAAIRAPDVLSRDLLAEIHPLAAARVLLAREDFQRYAESVLRDALHPLPIVREELDESAQAAAAEWQARVRVALEAFAVREGLDPKSWRGAPARDDVDLLTYCPRCAESFLLAKGSCSRCSELPLASY